MLATASFKKLNNIGWEFLKAGHEKLAAGGFDASVKAKKQPNKVINQICGLFHFETLIKHFNKTEDDE